MLKFQGNKYNEQLSELQLLAKIVKIDIIIKKDAYDMYGNKLIDSSAIYVDEDVEGNDIKMEILSEMRNMLHYNLALQLKDLGVDKWKILNTPFTIHTVKTYFPEVADKITIPDINVFYEKAKEDIFRISLRVV